jgi:hypothetical protein
MLDFLIWARRPRQLNTPRGSRCPQNKLMYPQFPIRSTYFFKAVVSGRCSVASKNQKILADQGLTDRRYRTLLMTSNRQLSKAFTDH